MRIRACFCIIALSFVPSLGVVGAHSASASSPLQTVAGYGIDTPSTVDLAAAEGVQIAEPFATLSALAANNPSGLREMQKLHMQMVSTDLLQDIDNYGCWHEWTFVGPGSDYCSGAPSAYSSFGADASGLQGANNTLIAAITSDLNAVKSSAYADTVAYFTVLDRWPARDPASGQLILQEVNSLIHSITPGKQSICSFPFGYLVPLKTFKPYSNWLDVNHAGASLQNFSPSGCDNVAVYGYAQRSPSNPVLFTAANYDWTMSKVLQPWINALIQIGTAADPSWNRHVILFGVGQLFGQSTTASGNYFVVPLLDSITAQSLGVPIYQPIVDQETAFCRAGMSIMPFAWNLGTSQYPFVQTPVNNAAIDAGMRAAVGDCQAIWQGATTTTVSSSAANGQSSYGQNLSLTASVTANSGTPTGSVAFLDGQTQFGRATLSNGQATFTPSRLTAGTHSISVVYTPNAGASFMTSTSAQVPQSVNPAPLTITAASPTITYGAAIPAISPRYAGLQNGQSAPASPPSCGTTASAGADAGTYVSSCSGAIDPNYTISYPPGTVTITPIASSTSISSSSSTNTSSYGDSITLSAQVTSSFGTPSGTIEFMDGSTQLGSSSLSSGSASFATSTLGSGEHPLSAVFIPATKTQGGSNYTSSASATLQQTVNQAPLTITAGSAAIDYGAPIPVISPSYSGLKNGSSAPISPPVCGTTATQGSPAGTYVTSCSGASDPNYSISYVPGTLTIGAIASTTTLTSNSPSDASSYGDTVTLTATVSASSGTPEGTVTFMDGASQLGAAPLASGVASISTSLLAVGNHPLTAEYAPSSSPEVTNYTSSSSSTVTQSVAPALLTITASSPTLTYGSAIPAISPSYSGLRNSASAPYTPPSCTSAAIQGSDAGTYTTSCSGASDANYTISYAPGTATITAAESSTSISSSSPINTPTYGDSISLSAVVTSPAGTPPGTVAFMDGSTRLGSASLSLGSAVFATSALGARKHSLSAVFTSATNSQNLANYADSTSTILKQTVGQALLTITARNISVARGRRLPPLGWRANFVNHDSQVSFTRLPRCSTRAKLDRLQRVISRPGRYLISCSKAIDPNYKIKYVSGQLKVRRKSA